MAAPHSHNFNLPPGFRFYPTDEELVVHFLHRKAALLPCHPDVIPDLNLFTYDPWELDGIKLFVYSTPFQFISIRFCYLLFFNNWDESYKLFKESLHC